MSIAPTDPWLAVNRDAFVSEQELRLDGYEPANSLYGGLTARLMSQEPIQRQFDAFVDRVVTSVGNRYLPVYRMADGEFAFTTGFRNVATGQEVPALRRCIAGALRAVMPFRQATCWGEQYSRSERTKGLENVAAGLRLVAQSGIIAAYFMRRPDGWAERYFEPVCDYFDSIGVALTPVNYVPFYFVYALLSGRHRKRLFHGRRILVVTHLTERRVQGITRGLLGEGASDVEFLPVSPDKSLLDRVPMPHQHGCAVALVAAGIGSINVLRQLEGFPGPCIDGGAAVDAYVTPGVRDERPFLRLRT